MEYSLDLRTGSKQKESSKAVMEKIQSPRACEDMKFPDQRKTLIKDKRKVESKFGQPFINRSYEFRRGAVDEPMVQLKSSGTKQYHSSRSSTNKSDELVKHMSNLPGYLQQVERGENSQRNALNFGVLNWESLEKWKYGENRLHTKGNLMTSSSTRSSTSMPKGPATVPGTSRTKSLAPQRKKPTSNSCRLNTSYDQRSQENLIQLRKFETPQRSTLNGGKSYSEDIKLDKGKIKESYQTTASENTLSDRRNPGSPPSSHDRINSKGDENKRTADAEFNQEISSGHQSIDLPLPNQFTRKSCSSSSQLSESRTSFDSTLTESHLKKFQDFSSPEFHCSVDLNPGIPHSCPLPMTDNQSDIELRSYKYLKCQYPNDIATAPSKGKHEEDFAEHPPSKGRFSFSISRMTRSLSSKEGSVSSRAKSSPLRRLLDPLLKPKETNSAEIPQPSKLNFDYVSSGERVQALLQITVKDRLPLFKLVVDNSRDILAAALKNPTTSVKDNTTSLTYAFYSVSEIKKKSGGWMTQGSKDKKSGFGFNIVGEMKVSSSYLSDLIEQNMYGPDVVQEFVLYGGDLGSVEKELAAIVLKNPIEENQENCKRIMIILPDGVHGLPNEGQPSSLLSRWRGKCECEGWDLGCELQILTNGDESNKNSKPSMSRFATDRLDLFVQGKESKPVFSLAPLKDGLYSVEYNASMSTLQAFSICIAFMNSLKSNDVIEVNSLSEAKCIPEPMTGKFFLTPPPSPVGRA